MAPSSSFDRIADALGNQTRREVLVALQDRNPLTLDDLVQTNAEPAPAAGGVVGSEERRIVLHHTHLPKLESTGYVDWSPDADTIVKGENWEEIAPVLEVFDERGDELPVEWP